MSQSASQSASRSAALPAASPRARRAALLPLLLLLAVGSMLGVTAVNAKAAVFAGWPPLALLAWSNLGAAALQFAVAAAAGRRFDTGAPVLRFHLISGLLFALPNALAFGAAQHVGAGIVALCFAFPLILTYALALGFRLERLSTVRLAGVLLGLAGGVIIAGGDAARGLAPSPWLLAALSAPVVIAAGNLYRSLNWPQGTDALALAPCMLAMGGVSLVVGLVLTGQPLQPVAWSPAALAFLVGQTAIFTLLYLLYFALQKLAGPVYLSQIGSVGALVGIALATVVLDEALTLKIIAAATLVAGGIVLVNRGVRQNVEGGARRAD